MARAQVYRHVGALHPKRSVFNYSHTRQFDCDMGKVIPVCCMEAYPGERWLLSNECVIRFNPLVAPVLHEIYMRTFYFFVPFRLLQNSDTMDELGDNGTWEDFITGGVDGNDTTSLPLWIPPPGGYPLHSLWDYFSDLGNPNQTDVVIPATAPIAYPKRAYNLVWNEYFRDQNLQDPVALDSDQLLNIAWSKDRFTTALYDTQRGNRPALPLSGYASAVHDGHVSGLDFNAEDRLALFGMRRKEDFKPFIPSQLASVMEIPFSGTRRHPFLTGSVVNNDPQLKSEEYVANFNSPTAAFEFQQWLNTNHIDLSNLVTVDTIDMRRMFQLQKYLERNMRSGARYTEQIKARFGQRAQDMRLQRPEFIGGTRSPIIISEVLQTGESTSSSPQGNLAGHGITAEKARIGRYTSNEHGYIIGLFCVQPVPMYNLGTNKQYLRRTKYDFLTPELVNLSEVAVLNAEVCNTGTARDKDIFGFQGIYDELRIRESGVAGNMRPTGQFNYWNLARDDFNALNPPSLNANFIRCEPSKRIFAVQNEPGLIVNYANIVRAVRPLPIIAEPGLIDHH